MAHCQVQEWNPEGSIAVVDQITESGGTEFGMKAHQEPEKGLSVCLSVPGTTRCLQFLSRAHRKVSL